MLLIGAKGVGLHCTTHPSGGNHTEVYQPYSLTYLQRPPPRAVGETGHTQTEMQGLSKEINLLDIYYFKLLRIAQSSLERPTNTKQTQSTHLYDYF